MTKEFIKYFVDAGKNVMESFGLNMTQGDVSIRKSPFKANSLVVVIGITGALHGQIMLNFDQNTAYKVASAMMGGMEIDMDEIAKSAIAELANMIIGNAVTLLSHHNILIDITPPSVLAGDNIQISTVLLTLDIPFVLENGGQIEFSVTAKELSLE